jgi:predicted ester cyclase
MSGTHKGEIEGIPPTGKKVTIRGISIEHVVGGKFVETWETYDTLGFMQQLGVVAAPK